MPRLLDTLQQDEMWYGEDSFPYVIEEMETSHIENVIRFLGRRAENIYKRHRFFEALTEVHRHPQAPQLESDPLEWLAKTPLIQKMEQVLKVREALEPETLQIEGANPGVMVVKRASQG